jgi:drug/metabolite transporter (DMT)-like permease
VRHHDDNLQRRRQRLTGIALMCGAVVTFACLDATGKFLIAHMDPLQVVWARYTSAFVLALLLSNPLARPMVMKTSRPWLQIVRSALLLLSTMFSFYALRYLQLDQALAIMFATPFLVALMSGPILGEWVGWRRWLAISAGFCGILLVTRPGFGGIHPAALLSFASAVCYALYGISTRTLSRTDSNETTLFYSNLVGAVAMAPVIYFVWTAPQSWFIAVLMVALGAFGAFGHYILIAGHRLAPASVLSPYIYTQLLWAVALGFLVFGNIPNGWTIAGSAVVICSGLYLLYRERMGGTTPSTGTVA